MDFYLTVFKNSTKHGEMKMGGKVLTVSFELNGQRFTAMNGSPKYKFTEAISFSVRCETQAEIDNYWTKLTADGGSESQCGWLKGQVRPELEDCAVQPDGSAEEHDADAGHDGDEEAGYRCAGAGREIGRRPIWEQLPGQRVWTTERWAWSSLPCRWRRSESCG